LRRLVHDPTVVGPALSSLQRTIGATAMAPIIDGLLADDNPKVLAAKRQLSRARRRLG
jgi:hypothetical protein